jgi:Ca-activated chloride channel family protein
LQVPLTLDRETVKILLMEAFIGLAGEKTAIGDAITLAVKRIHDQEEDAGEQVLVLLTDGANTAGEIDPMKAAELAAQVGLRIYTIGIGAEQLEVASIIGGRRRVNPSADLDEETRRAGVIFARPIPQHCRTSTGWLTSWNRSRNRKPASGRSSRFISGRCPGHLR